MAELVSGANSMVIFKGKKFQIQSQFTSPKVVTVVIIDGQVRQRFETEVGEQLEAKDYSAIQKILNTQHTNIEKKIRAKAKQKENESDAAPAPQPEILVEEPAEKPKKRGLLGSILRRKKK